MSRYIATRAIRGANALVTEAELMLGRALSEKGSGTKLSFPNTAYYLPTILGMTGKTGEKIGDLKPVLDQARQMLHPVPATKHWTPYLGETLDAGMATLLAAESIEALRFIYGLQPEQLAGFQLAGGTAFTSPDGQAPANGNRVTSKGRLMIFSSGRGASNSWMAACLASPRSLAAHAPMRWP